MECNTVIARGIKILDLPVKAIRTSYTISDTSSVDILNAVESHGADIDVTVRGRHKNVITRTTRKVRHPSLGDTRNRQVSGNNLTLIAIECESGCIGTCIQFTATISSHACQAGKVDTVYRERAVRGQAYGVATHGVAQRAILGFNTLNIAEQQTAALRRAGVVTGHIRRDGPVIRTGNRIATRATLNTCEPHEGNRISHDTVSCKHVEVAAASECIQHLGGNTDNIGEANTRCGNLLIKTDKVNATGKRQCVQLVVTKSACYRGKPRETEAIGHQRAVAL